MSYCNVPSPRATLQRYQGLQSTAPATKCHTGAAPATQRHTATYPSLHQPPRATLQRYQDASITCHQMSHWCCACHATSRCNAHATYSPHQPPRPTLQRYQDASIDCACHQMSHWCCATASHCNAPFPAPATQSHAPTLPGCFNHLPPNVTLVLRLPHNVTLQRTCNVPFPAPATQSHAPTLPGSFNRLRLPPNVTLVLRLPHNVTIQRTVPCTSHTDPRCNWKCHVYKRANFTCTSEPISRGQANPHPISFILCQNCSWYSTLTAIFFNNSFPSNTIYLPISFWKCTLNTSCILVFSRHISLSPHWYARLFSFFLKHVCMCISKTLC